MQYKCETCHDSGSKNQTGDYLDCPACDMPMIRKALNDFVKSLCPTHPEDVALAIHQRALAMAPKQEADHINYVVKMVVPEGWKLVPEDPTGDMFRAAAKIDNEMFAGGSSHGAEDGQVWAAMYDAAPEAPVAAAGPDAALNNASDDIFDLIRELAHLPEGQRGDATANIIGCLNRSYSAGVSDGKELGKFSAQYTEIIRNTLLGVIPAKMVEKHGRDFFQGEGQDEHRAEVKGFNACRDEVYDKANKAFQAALSGAKGN